jgi:hypothetical protein
VTERGEGPSTPLRDDAPIKSIEIFERVDWYRARPEPESLWSGTLEHREEPVGPATRGGLTYTLGTARDELSVYAPNVASLLNDFAGRPVLIRGKLVDLSHEGGGRELWIGTIGPAAQSAGRA